MFSETTATKKIMAMTKRVRAVAGGTSASKTISILLYLIAMAQTDEKPTLTSVVSESIPHLKKGALRDFKKIMQAHGYWDEKRWHGSDRVYTFETGSQIEFFSAGEGDELKGGRRDRLFMNECNNLTFNAYNQLEVRTKEFVFLDWNPDNEFWFYNELEGTEDVEFVTLTYLDNEALDEQIVAAIEKRKTNKAWWRVYGMGLLGDAEGRIFTKWNVSMGEIPEEAKYLCTGLDFGYSNDPTAAVDIYEWNGGIILDEVIYRKGLLNSQIYTLLTADELDRIVIADSAEPKSIAELRAMGLAIQGATKGQGSVLNGIQYVQGLKVWVTKTSTNIIKEYRNYMWTQEKSKDRTKNVPQDLFNHAMDAIRYGLGSRIAKSADDERLGSQRSNMFEDLANRR